MVVKQNSSLPMLKINMTGDQTTYLNNGETAVVLRLSLYLL